MKRLLEKQGQNVITVMNGNEAIKLLKRESFDLILMDIQLAGRLDGIEAAEKIVKQKKIPIAFMTGYATDYIKERADVVNPIGFYEKPVLIWHLNPLINQLKNK